MHQQEGHQSVTSVSATPPVADLSTPDTFTGEAQALQPPPPKGTTSGAIFRRAFSFPILLGALLIAGAITGARFRVGDPDMWGHVVVGTGILSTHQFPTTEKYSFTTYGNESLAFEWIGQVALAEAARAGGLRGLMFLQMALSAALIGLLYYCVWLRCRNSKAAFAACFLILPIIVGFFAARPQLLGFVFLLITIICFERYRIGKKKALWILPPLFVVWVNTHGSFMLGLIFFGLYWAAGLTAFRWGALATYPWTAQQRRHIALIVLLCLIGLTITPYGTRIAGFTLHVLLNATEGMTYITEYQTLGASGELLRLVLALLLPFLLAVFAVRPEYRLDEIVIFLVTLGGAFLHSRLLLLLLLVFAPLLGLILARWIPKYEPRKDQYALNFFIISLLVGVLFVKFIPSQNDLQRDVEKHYPERALQYLERHPVPGPMLNSFGWGSYLMWKWGPQRRIFIDGRSQMYEDAGVLSDYFRMAYVDRRTPFLLTRYGVRSCLVERDSAMATLFSVMPDWQRIYEDEVSVIFAKKNAGGGKAGENSERQ